MAEASSSSSVNTHANWTLQARGYTHKNCGYAGATGPAVHVEAGANAHHTEYHAFKVSTRYGLINITDLAAAVVARSGVSDGFLFASAMHITAGMYVNDAESGLLHDISSLLMRLAPFDLEGYRHHGTGEDNGDAHLKSLLVQHEVTLPVTGGKLDLGTWQQLFYMEGDGKRKKRIMFKVTGLAKSAKPTTTLVDVPGPKGGRSAAASSSEEESEEENE